MEDRANSAWTESVLLDGIQHSAFDYFLHEANDANGLVADKTELHSTRVGRIEYLVGDSWSRHAAPESRGVRALRFRAMTQFRTEHLNSLAVGR